MLPTNKESNLTLGGSINKDKLGLVEPDNRHPSSTYNCYVNNFKEGTYKYPQNNKWLNFQLLYILSDDEIKEGDWYFDTETKIICKSINNIKVFDCWKKIVATTDKSLKLLQFYDLKDNRGEFNTVESLPQLPESFIQAYIKAYNEGKPITEVDLEITCKADYDKNPEMYGTGMFNSGKFTDIIKTRPDNTVIWSIVSETINN